MELVLAFCEKSCAYGNPSQQQKCMALLNYYAPKLFTQADPNRLAAVLLSLPRTQAPCRWSTTCALARGWKAPSQTAWPPRYTGASTISPGSPESEMALTATAQIMLTAISTTAHMPSASYQELLRLFPYMAHGPAGARELHRLL